MTLPALIGGLFCVWLGGALAAPRVYRWYRWRSWYRKYQDDLQRNVRRVQLTGQNVERATVGGFTNRSPSDRP